MRKLAPLALIVVLLAAYLLFRGAKPDDAPGPQEVAAPAQAEVAADVPAAPVAIPPGAAASAGPAPDVSDMHGRLARSCMPRAADDDPGLADLAELIRLNTSRDPADLPRKWELSLGFVRADPSGCAATRWVLLDPFTDGDAYREMVALYEAAVEPADAPTAVIAAYVGKLAVSDRGKALELLARLQEREPENPHWLDREGHMHMLDIKGANLGDEDVRKPAALAQEAYATALELAEDDERVDLLGRGVVAAALAGDAESAEEWGQALLRLAGDDPNSNHFRHIGHEGLGLAALLREDAEGAIAELLEMADVPPGPVQTSFGPQMRLANELLRLGHRDAVIAYLEKVATFWEPEGVAVWLAQIRAGETPTLNQYQVP